MKKKRPRADKNSPSPQNNLWHKWNADQAAYNLLQARPWWRGGGYDVIVPGKGRLAWFRDRETAKHCASLLMQLAQTALEEEQTITD
jgi:hypothetical protein